MLNLNVKNTFIESSVASTVLYKMYINTVYDFSILTFKSTFNIQKLLHIIQFYFCKTKIKLKNKNSFYYIKFLNVKFEYEC